MQERFYGKAGKDNANFEIWKVKFTMFYSDII